jgi:thiol-disulfide isomerase/thioredoxin
MVICADMRCRSVALFVTVLGVAVAGGDHVQPVNSWADYRALLKSMGRSDAEIDAQVARMLAALKTMDRTAGRDRIGVAAPPFEIDSWLNSKPLSIQDLRGRVVLVRWWTDTCPLCASTAPALRKLDEQYSARGLTVIGVFHPKAGRDDAMDVARVQRAVDARQLTFPIAIDWEWHTLNKWWLTGPQPAGDIGDVSPGQEGHHPIRSTGDGVSRFR